MISSKSCFDIKCEFYFLIFLVNESKVGIPILLFGKNYFVTNLIKEMDLKTSSLAIILIV